MKTYALYQRQTRTPDPLPPPRSCDCQVHVFGDALKYPPSASRRYDPPPASFEDARRMHRALGIERGVVVQATIYGADNRLLADCLQGQRNYRGVAIVDDSVSDQELRRLHQAGVRGARFNFLGYLGLALGRESFERSIARIEELGWFAKIHVTPAELIEYEDWLRALRLPAVIDHMAHATGAGGVDQPGVRLALDLLMQDNWWMMLSNGDRRSEQGYPWDDMVAIAQAYIATAPERVVWASDWPHVLYDKKMPNDADLLELLYRYVPDTALRHKVLVDNPQRLLGFND